MKINYFYLLMTLLIMSLILTGTCKKDEPDEGDKTVTDLDGNVYEIILIGTMMTDA